MVWPLQAAVRNSSVRSLTSTLDPSASCNTARAPGPVRTDSRSPMAAPAWTEPAATRNRPPSAETTVARGPPGAIITSIVSRPTYTIAISSDAAAASVPSRTQRDEERTGMSVTVLLPLISAIRLRQLGQRLRWSSSRNAAAGDQHLDQIRGEVVPELLTGRVAFGHCRILHGCRKTGVLNFSLRLPVRREASGLRLALAPFSRFQKSGAIRRGGPQWAGCAGLDGPGQSWRTIRRSS